MIYRAQLQVSHLFPVKVLYVQLFNTHSKGADFVGSSHDSEAGGSHDSPAICGTSQTGEYNEDTTTYMREAEVDFFAVVGQ